MNREAPGIHLYTSNRLEILAGEAAAIITRFPAASPFSREVLMVQTEGMKRWLSLQLAAANGISCNTRFMSPADLVALIRRDIMSMDEEGSPFERNSFPWSIMKLLNEPEGDSDHFAVLDDYARGNQLKQFQLSSSIADIFDQYAIYRQEMIRSWEEGALHYDIPHEHWQKQIWNDLKDRCGEGYLSRYASLAGCLTALETLSPEKRDLLPARMIVFGISVLPRFYIDLLQALALHVPVYLFLMNPCRYYWGDISSDRELTRLKMKIKKEKADIQDYHFDRGNPLLAAMGKTGRDFFTSVYSRDLMSADEISCYEEPEGNSLLHHIQRDILDQHDPAEDGSSRIILEQGDSSLRLASCHSPMREVEVLQDYLLSLFDRDRTLLPSQVLVLTPDINAYAPYIDAVFGVAEESVKIPYSIADRSIRSANRIAGLFLNLCDLAESRLEATVVLTFLGARPVRERFGLSLQDMDLVRQWVSETGIRWGLDGAFREGLGLPGYEENTWKAGLDRMLLGYAMKADGDALYNGILPFDQIEGALAGILGRFMTFMDRVISLVRGIGTDRSLSEWRVFFIEMLESFFLVDDEKENEVRYLRGQLDTLLSMERASGFSRPVTFGVMKHFFAERFDSEMTTRGFITGGLTFSSMVPLRSIPFRVVCLLGMNDDAFPRKGRPPGFDLMALQPLPGDRNTRDSDRYLFLETLLSAREKLYISYEGRSIRDNSEMPPSNVVVELLDYIADRYEFPGGVRASKVIVTEHPLQPFSPRYFTGESDDLFSYRMDNCAVAARLHNRDRAARNFYQCRIPLEAAQSDREDIMLEDMVRFLKNTSGHFLKRRLHVDFPDTASVLDDREYFFVEGLNRYMLSQDILRRHLGNESGEAARAVYGAMGVLPHGTAGDLDYESISMQMSVFKERITGAMDGREERDRTISLSCRGMNISATVRDLYGDDLVVYRPAKLKPMDRLRLWLYHLFLSAAGEKVRSTFIAMDARLVLEPVNNAGALLDDLAELFLQGLERPLPFFPGSSWAYVDWLRTGKNADRASAMRKAAGVWNGDFFITGEGTADPYVKLCFQGMDLPDMQDDFVLYSERVFGAFHACSREEKS